jgi:hypothetical protein
MTASVIYTGAIVEKYTGNLDKGETGIVLALCRDYANAIIYKVLANGVIKNWHGEFVQIKKKAEEV